MADMEDQATVLPRDPAMVDMVDQATVPDHPTVDTSLDPATLPTADPARATGTKPDLTLTMKSHRMNFVTPRISATSRASTTPEVLVAFLTPATLETPAISVMSRASMTLEDSEVSLTLETSETLKT